MTANFCGQLFQACRLCIHMTGIRSSSPSDNSRLFMWQLKVPSLRGAKEPNTVSGAGTGRQVIILETPQRRDYEAAYTTSLNAKQGRSLLGPLGFPTRTQSWR